MSNPLNNFDAPSGQALVAKERATRLSKGLSEAARRLRFSTTGRATVPGSYSARREARITRIVRIGSFVMIAALPSLTAIVYYGLIAADQYVAEAKFAVRSGALAGLDPISSMTGIPSVRVIQDTQVVTQFIKSRALVEHLVAQSNLRDVYSRNEADFFAKLDPEKPIERVVKYWNWMHSAEIEMPGGIVSLSVRAFRREDAVAIAEAVVEASEALVNDMNARARQDSVTNAQKQFERAGETLAKTSAALEVARNSAGILDASAQALKSFEIIGSLRSQKLDLQQQLAAAQRSTSRDAPQLRSIQFQIDAAEKQIAQLQAELTTTVPTAGTQPVLSASLTRFSALDVDRKVAEKEYADAATRLERARATNMVKQIYLTSFVKPVLPEEALYPKRWWSIFSIVIASFLVWSIVFSLVMFTRNRR